MPPRKSNISQATATDNDGGTPVKEREGTNIEVQYRPYVPLVLANPAPYGYLGPSPLRSPPLGNVHAVQVPQIPSYHANAHAYTPYLPNVISPGNVLPMPYPSYTNAQGIPLPVSPHAFAAHHGYAIRDPDHDGFIDTEKLQSEHEARNVILRENVASYVSQNPLYTPANPQYILPLYPREIYNRSLEGRLLHGLTPAYSQESIVNMPAKRDRNGRFRAPSPQAGPHQAANPQFVHYQPLIPQAVNHQAQNPHAVPYQAANPQTFYPPIQNPQAALPLQHRAMDPDSDYRGTQDLSLPRTMVQRLAKGVLQPNTSISKDALLALSKGATVFINYLAQSANEANLATNRKNIPPAAVFEGLSDIEFIDFTPRVEAELKRYNEVQTAKRNDYRRKVKEGKMGFGGRGNAGSGSGGDGDGEEGDERAAKRVRRDDGDSTKSPEASRENGTGDPNQQLQQQMAEDEEDEDEVYDPGTDEEVPEEDTRDLRQNPGEEDKDEDEDEDEDDEDAFPDEGMRLSSVERENYALDHPDDPVTPGSSADEDDSEEGSD